MRRKETLERIADLLERIAVALEPAPKKEEEKKKAGRKKLNEEMIGIETLRRHYHDVYTRTVLSYCRKNNIKTSCERGHWYVEQARVEEIIKMLGLIKRQ